MQFALEPLDLGASAIRRQLRAGFIGRVGCDVLSIVMGQDSSPSKRGATPTSSALGTAHLNGVGKRFLATAAGERSVSVQHVVASASSGSNGRKTNEYRSPSLRHDDDPSAWPASGSSASVQSGPAITAQA